MASNTEQSLDSRPPNRRYLRATLAGGAGGLLALLFFLLDSRPELARLLLERVLKPVYPEPRGAERGRARCV